MGIFSNNLDEFFQVRYATVKRIAQSSVTGKKVFAGRSAEALLKEITKKVIELQDDSLDILNRIYDEMEMENIFSSNSVKESIAVRALKKSSNFVDVLIY